MRILFGPASKLSLLLLVYAACHGADPMVPADMTTEPSPSASPELWQSKGNHISSTNSGNVGIGTDQPEAKLDVRGAVSIDEDASVLPAARCRKLRLDDPKDKDLGDLLSPILAKYACAEVWLAKGTTWVWNTRVEVRPFQILSVWGEDPASVTINMTKNGTLTWDNSPEMRVPNRVVVDDHARFNLLNVRLFEIANDPRALASPCEQAALFSGSGPFSSIDIWSSEISTSEHITSFQWPSVVRFTHVKIANNSGASPPRSVSPATGVRGSCPTGLDVSVFPTDVTLGANVAWDKAPGLRYSPAVGP